MFECENCERSFERTIKIGEEVRCPYCKSGDIVGGEKMEKTEKFVEMIKKEFKREPVIFLTEDGTLAQGEGSEVLSLLCCLIKSLNKNGIPKEVLKECFEIAFKNENELIDEVMKVLKELKGELRNE